MSITGQRVLVLGATGALGSAIATRLASAGALVLGTARNAASSTRLSPDLHERLLVDLEDPTSIRTLVNYLDDSGHGLDAVVNATGLVGFGSVTDTTAEDAARLMQVNHLGPAQVIAGLLPLLRESAEQTRAPFIASITGVVAERTFPGMSAYFASKSAHSAWLRALRLEVRRPQIRVLELRPGHTETGLSGRAIFGTAPAFPQGMTVDHVADVLIGAIGADVTELASTDF